MTGHATEGWVDGERGLVSRDAFVSDEVYRLELERIFDRTWILLGHDSEIPNAGDYVARRLGSAPVLVVREGGGEIRVLLNSCRHRGALVCRADSGNAANFVCPYHGWSYRHDGSLITTTFDQHFPEDTDFTALGLVAAPRIATRHGLIFASWNADIMPLGDYLGDIGWYLDGIFGRTPKGMEVLAPPHRWRAPANWKIGALNFAGDAQHVLTTHAGPVTLDKARRASDGFITAGEESFQVVTGEGHCCALTYLAPGMPAANYRTHAAELQPLYEQTLMPEQVKMLHHLRVIVGNIFPHFSFIETQADAGRRSVIIRLWQPVSGTEMEILSWVLAEKEAPGNYKAAVLARGVHNFGAAGMFEQDDLELWMSATEASDNPIARQFPFSFQTALPYIDRPISGHPWPGRAYKPLHTEVAQLSFMRHWDRLMRDGA